MEFPKDVVCINSDTWSDSTTGIIIKGYTHPKKNHVYKALGVTNGRNGLYYILAEFYNQYNSAEFRDLDDIGITEVTEILKEELCLI